MTLNCGMTRSRGKGAVLRIGAGSVVAVAGLEVVGLLGLAPEGVPVEAGRGGVEALVILRGQRGHLKQGGDVGRGSAAVGDGTEDVHHLHVDFDLAAGQAS